MIRGETPGVEWLPSLDICGEIPVTSPGDIIVGYTKKGGEDGVGE